MAACDKCSFDYFQVIAEFYNNDTKSLSFLRSHSVLPSEIICPHCSSESSCGRGEDGPVAFNAQRQSLGFLFWMATCSFTLYLLISHRMKAGGSVYSFIHSFIKGKCSRRYRKAQEDSGRLRKAPEMNIKHRHKQCIL